jgi:hypothetical protein
MAKERDQAGPTEEAIAKRAYELYLQRGSIAGTEVDDWLQAEAELIAEANAARSGRDRIEPGQPVTGPESRDIRPEQRHPPTRERNNQRRARAV